jgi:hypothetical protein
LFAPFEAKAIPALQLYMEGATYDTATETWTVAGPVETIRLWAIANTEQYGTIYGVRLSAVYDAGEEPVTITMTPSTTGGLGGFTDPSTPKTPTFIQKVTDGSTPVLGDGSNLPNHGQFGPGRVWQEFSLGNFWRTDSPIADFIDSFPTPHPYRDGQINVYEISIDGPNAPIEVHFDLYDHYYSGCKLKAKFAPFSHDAGGTGGSGNGVVPEPASMVLWSIAGLGFVGWRGLRRRKAA